MSYTWDAKNKVYIDSKGNNVSTVTVRELVYSMTEAAKEEAAQLMVLYMNKDIDLDQWQKEMKLLVKTVQVGSSVAAGGGFEAMTQSDWGWIGKYTQVQYKMLQGFTDEIRSANQGLEDLPSSEDLQARASMYASAGKVAYNGMSRRLAAKDGDNEEKRVLRPGANHCDDCVYYASLDWQPIYSMPPIGDTTCISNCYCTYLTRYNADRDTFSQSFTDGAGATKVAA